jgi:hypothetical protein
LVLIQQPRKAATITRKKNNEKVQEHLLFVTEPQ